MKSAAGKEDRDSNREGKTVWERERECVCVCVCICVCERGRE